MDYQHYLGKTQAITDLIDETLVRRMGATLSMPAPAAGEALPLLWHWMFFQLELTADKLGRDGHPALGEFLPKVTGRNRMWAGGRLEFVSPLIVGKLAKCITTIHKISEKTGSTGKLLFVTLQHRYYQHKGGQETLCLTEYQDIVYREPTAPKLTSHCAPEPEWQNTLIPNETLLFRYSGLTFNGHRIHYDYQYVTDVEGYQGLVVHGPLMATLALHGFIHAHPDKQVLGFEFKGVRATCVPNAIKIAGRLQVDKAEVWIANEQGMIQSGLVHYTS
ncbi:MAG: hypothetical protein Q4G13_03320 [Moraxella sp.]|nr:hypothetical protein [Moraxella sp.]